MRNDKEAQSVLKDIKSGMTWTELEARTKMTRGYLSRVIKGTRPASNRLRIALGMHPRVVTVAPLSCGHAPGGDRCYICHPAPPKRTYAPHPVKRVTAIRTLLQNPYYRDS